MKYLVPLLALFCQAIAGSAYGESLAYEEGTHYVALQIPIKTRDPAKVEVAEYFSYGCPHCYQFEPMINAWKSSLPADVEFGRTPAVWNKDYQVYAQTYLALYNAGYRDLKLYDGAWVEWSANPMNPVYKPEVASFQLDTADNS